MMASRGWIWAVVLSGLVAGAAVLGACGSEVQVAGDAGAGGGSADAGSPTTTTGGDVTSGEEPPGCTILGAWHTHSDPWNGQSTDAVVDFHDDGTLVGTPAFTGQWSLSGSTLTISNTMGADMTCPYEDHWTLTFADAACQTAPLVPIDSGCTGARRYLDWNVTLTRK